MKKNESVVWVELVTDTKDMAGRNSTPPMSVLMFPNLKAALVAVENLLILLLTEMKHAMSLFHIPSRLMCDVTVFA
jgi:hypothetical protein